MFSVGEAHAVNFIRVSKNSSHVLLNRSWDDQGTSSTVNIKQKILLSLLSLCGGILLFYFLQLFMRNLDSIVNIPLASVIFCVVLFYLSAIWKNLPLIFACWLIVSISCYFAFRHYGLRPRPSAIASICLAVINAILLAYFVKNIVLSKTE